MGSFPGRECTSEKQEQAFPERQNSQDFWFLRIKNYFSSVSVCLSMQTSLPEALESRCLRSRESQADEKYKAVSAPSWSSNVNQP